MRCHRSDARCFASASATKQSFSENPQTANGITCLCECLRAFMWQANCRRRAHRGQLNACCSCISGDGGGGGSNSRRACFRIHVFCAVFTRGGGRNARVVKVCTGALGCPTHSYFGLTSVGRSVSRIWKVIIHNHHYHCLNKKQVLILKIEPFWKIAPTSKNESSKKSMIHVNNDQNAHGWARCVSTSTSFRWHSFRH